VRLALLPRAVKWAVARPSTASGEVGGGLTRRVMLASTALVVLVGGAFAVLLVAVDSMRDSGALARHSRVEVSAANRLEKLVVDLETGQRGSVITHEPRFVAPWRVARSAVPVAGRRQLTVAGDRGHRPQASRLVRAVRSYIQTYAVPLVAAARRGDPDVESVGATLRGKGLVDALRARFNKYVATQRDLLTARPSVADAEAHRATVAASAGLVGSIVLIVLFASYLARAILVPIRRVAGMARRIAGDAARGLAGAVAELQEISRGIHPAILSRGGLREALKALARRSSVPVELHVAVDGELPGQVEVASYYLVSEALTNAAKYARASVLQVDAETDDGVLRLSITDDGLGGADPEAGSGLVGLKDRVEALGGDLRISSAPGHGTALNATIPIGSPR
jgi:CHASE3 domain sensor protein